MLKIQTNMARKMIKIQPVTIWNRLKCALLIYTIDETCKKLQVLIIRLTKIYKFVKKSKI